MNNEQNNILLENSFEEKQQRRSFKVLFFFVLFFFVLFPLCMSRMVGKPMHPIDWSPMSTYGGDYIATYVAAHSLLNGVSFYKNNASKGDEFNDHFATGEYSRYSYPPLQAFLFTPLSLFSFEKSYLVWNIISFFLIVSSIALVSQFVKIRLYAFVFLSALYILSSFLWFHFERGQTDSVTLFFISLLLYFYFVRKNTVLTSLFLAMACLLKIFPFIFWVFFLIRKEYKLLLFSFLFSVGIVFFTGFQTWAYWINSILPMYSSYYLGSEVDHSFAYLLSGFLDLPFSSVVELSRIILCIIAGIFFFCVFMAKNRDEWLMIELAILFIIMEIFPPWAANYKLVIMVFLFILPWHLVERGFFGKKFAFVVPILASFILFLPIYNESYGRMALSLFGWIVPTDILPYFSLQKIGEYRASLSIAFCLVYLLFLYVYFQFRDTRIFERVIFSLNEKRKNSFIILSIIILFLGISGVIFLTKYYFVVKAEYQDKIRNYGKEHVISDGVSVVGFGMHKRNSSSGYEVEIIFKIDKPLEKNFSIYLHGHWLDGSGTVEGTNFFPPMLTNFWSPGKLIVVQRTVFFTPKEQDIKMGFFDMSNGDRFGDQVDFGISDLQ